MFKEGQVYKVKVELSPDLMGFGRATVIGVDANRIYIQLKSGKGNKLNVPAGTKIWFVGSSLNNKFNGLWSSEVKGIRLQGGITSLECRLPRFEKFAQRRNQARTELVVSAELCGDEWKDLAGKVITRNISRLGLGFAVNADCAERFTTGVIASIILQVGSANLQTKIKLVNSRYNWLLNRTEIGAEFIDMDASALESLDKVLVWLGNRPSCSKAALSESGSLAKWVKAGKDDHSFLNPAEQTAIDLEQSVDDDDDFETMEPPDELE